MTAHPHEELLQEKRAPWAIFPRLGQEVAHFREEPGKLQGESQRLKAQLKQDPSPRVKPPRKAEPKRPGHVAQQIRVLMAGPLPRGRGGVGTAAGTLLSSPTLSRQCMIFYVTSWRWGSALTKILVFAWGLPRFIYQLWFKPVDLVHLHMAHGASFYRKAILALLAMAFRKPYIIQLHSGRIEQFALQSRIHRRMVRFILDRARAVVVLYQASKRRARRLTCNPHLFVLPNPVDVEAIVSSMHAHTEETDPIQAPTGRHVVRALFMGDIVPEKGVVDLLRAIPMVVERCPQVQFILCGKGRIGEMRRLCKENGSKDVVEFRGWISGREKMRLFQQADLFLLPSHLDELPVAILEAMAFGLPVIATQVGGIPEAVEHGGSGLLIPPGDSGKLAEALICLIEDAALRRRMGERGRRLAEAKFNQDRVAKKLIPVYNFCLGRERAAT